MEHSFTEAMFWDTDSSQLDLDKHCAYIIERVLNYGNLDDWKKLKEIYSAEKILSEAKQIRDLHPKTLSFLSAYFNIPKTKFRCYKQRQSSRAHYPY